MQIDLRKTKTICISMKTEENRRKEMSHTLAKLGYERWSFYDGIVGKDAIEGCALSHIGVLSSHDFSEPLLLIEDDAHESPFYNPIIDIPDDADAFYAGYSWWAWSEERAMQSKLPGETKVVKSETRDNVYKISYMLSTHAILYITKEYANAAVKAIEKYLVDPDGNRHCDVALGKIQNKYKVYAPSCHLFFQLCPKNAYWTNREIVCSTEHYLPGVT